MAEWTEQQVQQSWNDEIRARFELENTNYRAYEQRDIDKLAARGVADILGVRDSFLYAIWKDCRVTFEHNQARVVLPKHSAIYCDMIAMFNETEVAWGHASVGAELVDGEPYVVIEVMLIDSWDDERSVAWRTGHASPSPELAKILDWSEK